MKRWDRAVFLLVVAVLNVAGMSFAEPPTSGAQAQVSLRGASRQRVITELGAPDEQTEESLTYGRSKIFFQDDKVIGISGSEELSKRATLNSNLGLSRRQPTRRDDLRGEWISPWSSR